MGKMFTIKASEAHGRRLEPEYHHALRRTRIKGWGTVPVSVGDAASSRVKCAKGWGTVPVGVGDAASNRVKCAKVVANQSLD